MYQSNSSFFFDFFFNDTATTEIYTYLHTLSLHYALPISTRRPGIARPGSCLRLSASAEYPCHIGTEHPVFRLRWPIVWRSEEHTSELQSLMRISYAVFCLKKKNKQLSNRL